MSEMVTLTPEEFAAKMMRGCDIFHAGVELPSEGSYGLITFEYENFIGFCEALVRMCVPDQEDE